MAELYFELPGQFSSNPELLGLLQLNNMITIMSNICLNYMFEF